ARPKGGTPRRMAGKSPMTEWASRYDGLEPRRAGGAASPGRRRALSRPPSVPSAAERRKAAAPAGPGLGAEPLLLPVHDPDQGCDDPGADDRSGAQAHLAPAHRRP